MKPNSQRSSVSQADSYERIGEFWDRHDFTDHDDPRAADVKFPIRCAVPLELDLITKLEEHARRRGVSVETLVNLWLQERLAKTI